ncbi:acetyltransferase (isoleucine patch superfamily)-like protein [Haloarcula vallismortis ATCC 29715]|nr:acetyltransferase (isoleucine patch superfamily)-like protein [Haloarcula vallismortis ATCC 29715]
MLRQHDHMSKKPSLQDRFYRDMFDTRLERVSKGPITVGNDVWIGARATVLSGVTIGNGAIVGAGAIVTDDVDPYSVVAGVPAAHKKWRFREEIREELLEIKWWDWSEEKIQDNEAFFDTDLSKVNSVHALINT